MFWLFHERQDGQVVVHGKYKLFDTAEYYKTPLEQVAIGIKSKTFRGAAHEIAEQLRIKRGDKSVV